eukprot:TRINITY_DN8629_c0_g1_i1.p1 TRINITY_DN8629_c0_g1~~TRINITY_DN8629_c0_g1_i1.p1  ORF type:complete len:373 (+),score=91.32 TRINITY_DN8629_c0_g1_i1:248-1366(+)
MDALRKQAHRFREQVARQQHAVLRQFTGHGAGDDAIITDEAELRCHQQLQKLYASTRAAKYFQRDIVRGVEGLISTNSKQMEHGLRLAEECCKYATDGPHPKSALSRAASCFGKTWMSIEKEREKFNHTIGHQVAEPLRAMVVGAPLEDARHLAQRYDRMRQEVEAQVADVERKQHRSKDVNSTADNAIKLQAAETKLSELISTMTALGKEATSAMLAVETQQQRLTFQRLTTLVEAERLYNQRVADILDKLYAQIAAERQGETGYAGASTEIHMPPPSYEEVKANGCSHNEIGNATQRAMYFLAEVVFPFDAEAEGELSIAVGDYVVVRQVTPNGWSEGECNGKAGWFPSAYVERRERAPLSKIGEAATVL